MATAYGAFEEEPNKPLETEGGKPVFQARRLAYVVAVAFAYAGVLSVSGVINQTKNRTPQMTLDKTTVEFGDNMPEPKEWTASPDKHNEDHGDQRSQVNPVSSIYPRTSSSSSSDSSSESKEMPSHVVVAEAGDGYVGIAVTNKYISSSGALDSVNDYAWTDGHTIIDVFKPATFWVVGGSDTSDRCQWTFERKSEDQNRFELDLTEDFEDLVSVYGNCAHMVHSFKNLGRTHVSVTLADGTSSRVGTVHVKYVRREMRAYDDEDRVALMEAWQTVAETDDATGVEKYGVNFMSLGRLATLHNNLAGDKACDHLHDGMGFVPGHVSMTRLLEASLQSVDPSVSMPYWEYTIDVEDINSNHDGNYWAWRNLSIFSDEWFGAADEDTGLVSTGFFANFDLTANEWTEWSNPYGLIRSPWNGAKSNQFVRYIGGGSALGVKPTIGVTYDQMSTCQILDETLNASTDLGTFNGAAAGQAHGPVHMFTGGQSNTPDLISRLDDLGLSAASPYYEQFWGTGVTFNFASIKSLWRYDLWTCPTSCSSDAPVSECACSCDVNDIWSRQDVLDALFKEDMERNGNQTVYELIRLMCEMNPVMGDHASSGSASDPSFWVVHGTVERWFDLMIIEDRFTDTEWHAPERTVFTSNIHPFTAGCRGHQANDTLVFGDIDGYNFTNLEYFHYLDPTKGYTPYVYDNFRWEHCAALGHRIRHT